MNTSAKVTVRYADVRGAAEFLGISEKGLRKLVERRAIPFRRRSTRLLFDLRELEAWADSLPRVHLEEAITRIKEPEGFLA